MSEFGTWNTIVVFTARSPARIIREGGSQAWRLNPARAKQSTWLVCTQNRNHPDHRFSDATEPHGSAFLLAEVASIQPCLEHNARDRWKIVIGRYARIDIPDLWDHGRNPVRYSSLRELGIDINGIEFQPPPKGRIAVDAGPPIKNTDTVPALTITQAKQALAIQYGVEPSAIEITIRG